ncbi:SpaH/EbpB family LPXTG-anchored major pilin [Microbacterium sp. 1P10UB]|uniref:SpaH/EbpB family LPXTG-anchored major pilin n=1 Tax=unclassified Microbacterium TaxID=2609290 RepID=UPI0039A185A3
MSTSFPRRAGAVVGVLTLALVGAFAAAVPATAVTLPGNIDPDQARSLTVHKYELSPTSPQAGGTGQLIPGGIPGAVPIEGVEFTATLVPSVNLLTPAGWSTASSLTPASAQSQATGASFTVTTNAAGEGTFPANMPLGLYLVTETAAPATVTDRTAPFLVTLPFPTGPTGSPSNQWIYDVHVYPKNSVTALVKTRVVPAPNTAEARNPDLVRWSIRASIPTLAGTPLSQFTVSDRIDTGLQFVATPPAGVTPTSVTVTNAVGAAQVFVDGTDYSLTTTGNTQTLTFTPAGRTRLSSLGGGTVDFTVLTRAVSVPAGGQITNTATSVVNGATETVSAVTPIGELTVFAYAPTAGGVKTPLAGAVFQAFANEADARAFTNPLTVNGVDRWTTDANGIANIPALVPGVYWGREIVPPAGYQVPSIGPTSVQVVAGPTSRTQPIQNYIEIPHTQVPAWALPLTGGDGALWFGIGGGALVVVAIGAAVLVARRRAGADRVTV